MRAGRVFHEGRKDRFLVRISFGQYIKEKRRAKA
jgi:hypothetical protein